MKRLALVSSLLLIMNFSTFADTNVTVKENNKAFLMLDPESCFSFYHNLYTEYFGGINLDNVGDFLDAVANCQATFE